MGGGDLNLKKSWHPSTFSNLEKVWKAEQKHESEQKKIAQLQQELKEERSREEMQRTAIEAGLVKKKDCRVDWMYSGPASTVNREEYLLGKKIDKLVDPTLVEEEREREALASGPGALFVDSGTAANSGTDLAIKVREDPLFLIKQKEIEAKKKLVSNPIKLKQLKQLLASEGKNHKKKKHKGSREREQHYESSSQRPKRDHSPASGGHSHQQDQTHTRTDKTTHKRYASRYNPYPKPRSRTKGMDPEELKRRREEMMSNAKDHAKDRERRLRRHEQEQKRSEELVKTEKKSDFLQPLRVQSLSSCETLGDRIHRNIGTIQRTAARLDSNFMKK